MKRKYNRRLLSDSDIISLSINDVIISPDGTTITITSPINGIDMTLYNLNVDFAAGLLITADGKPFATLSTGLYLNNPEFLASYYSVNNAASKMYEVPGIVFYSVASVFLIASFWNKKVYH